MTDQRDHRLPLGSYLAFPFRMTADGGARSQRIDHIREQVEQVLFTSPGERVFRPELGAGIRALVFEGNRSQLWDLVQNRLYGSLAEALAGEIDPKTLKVEVTAAPGAPESLVARVSYVIAALQKEESHELPL
jgi:hypothetical protein